MADTATDMTGIIDPVRQAIAAQKAAESSLGMPELDEKIATQQDKIDRINSEREKADIAAAKDIAKSEDKLGADEIRMEQGYPTGTDIQPPKPDPVTMKDVQANIFPLLLMATLAGAGQRRHAVGALSAFGAMMKGAEEGRSQTYENAQKEYENKIKALKQTQDEYTKRFNAILKNDQMDMTRKMNAVKLLDMEYGHQAQDEGRTLNKLIDAHSAKERTVSQLVENAQRIDEKIRDQREKRMKADAPLLTPEARTNAAWKYILTGNDSEFGMASKELRVSVIKEASKIAKNIGLSPQELAMLPQNNAVQKKAQGSLIQWGAFIKKSQGVLEKSTDLALALASKMSPTEINIVNRAVLEGKTQFNDPIARQFSLALNTIRTEYARLLQGPTSNAMLTMDANKEADKLISNGVDYEGLKGIRTYIEQEAKINNDEIQGGIYTLEQMSMNPYKLRAGGVEGPGAAPQPMQGAAPAAPALPAGGGQVLRFDAQGNPVQ